MKKGFTLIEMIIVLVLISIITLVGSQVYSNLMLKKKIEGTRELVSQMVKVIETWRVNEKPDLTYAGLDNTVLLKRGVPVENTPFGTPITVRSDSSFNNLKATISFDVPGSRKTCEEVVRQINLKSGALRQEDADAGRYAPDQNLIIQDVSQYGSGGVLYYAQISGGGGAGSCRVVVTIQGYKI